MKSSGTIKIVKIKVSEFNILTVLALENSSEFGQTLPDNDFDNNIYNIDVAFRKVINDTLLPEITSDIIAVDEICREHSGLYFQIIK